MLDVLPADQVEDLLAMAGEDPVVVKVCEDENCVIRAGYRRAADGAARFVLLLESKRPLSHGAASQWRSSPRRFMA